MSDMLIHAILRLLSLIKFLYLENSNANLKICKYILNSTWRFKLAFAALNPLPTA